MSQEYYDNLLAGIREVRASERRFYQTITDIYATAMDYNAEAETTQEFSPPCKTNSTSPFTGARRQN